MRGHVVPDGFVSVVRAPETGFYTYTGATRDSTPARPVLLSSTNAAAGGDDTPRWRVGDVYFEHTRAQPGDPLALMVSDTGEPSVVWSIMSEAHPYFPKLGQAVDVEFLMGDPYFGDAHPAQYCGDVPGHVSSIGPSILTPHSGPMRAVKVIPERVHCDERFPEAISDMPHTQAVAAGSVARVKWRARRWVNPMEPLQDFWWWLTSWL